MTKSKQRRALEQALQEATTVEQHADIASRLDKVVHHEAMERARKRRAKGKPATAAPAPVALDLDAEFEIESAPAGVSTRLYALTRSKQNARSLTPR